MEKIKPCLWFDDKAEEAANFYVSVFKKDSRIDNIARYGKDAAAASGRPEGSAMTVDFRLHGQEFLALNGGPIFKFTEAISLIVSCDDQNEIDYMWEKLSEGGAKSRCGWLKDKYGLSWQIVPEKLRKMMQSSDPEKANRVMAEILKMDKLDIKTLLEAFEGK